MPAEGLDVLFLIVWFPILPTTEQNSNPLVGKSSQSGVMIVAAGALLVVVGAGPQGEANRLVRKFMKGLLDEFRTSQPMVDPQGFAAALWHRSDAGGILVRDSGI